MYWCVYLLDGDDEEEGHGQMSREQEGALP
jgi:hypothetical protein